MTKCSVCNSPNLAAIDGLLESGEFKKNIAQQFNVSPYAISRHARHSKLAEALLENSEGESLEVQAARWLRRADDIYDRSIVDGDVRGQVQALTGAFRGLELQHRAELKAAEAKPETGADSPLTLELIDECMRHYESKVLNTPRGRALDSLRNAPDDLLQMAAKLIKRPDLTAELERKLCASQLSN